MASFMLTCAAWLLEAAAGPHGVTRAQVLARMGRSSAQRCARQLLSTEQIVPHVYQLGKSRHVRYFRTALQLDDWLAGITPEPRAPVVPPSPTPAPLPAPVLPQRYDVSGLYAVAGELTHCAGTMPIDQPHQPQRRLLPTAEAAPYVRRPDSRQADRLPSRQGDWLIYPGGHREHAPLPPATRRAQEPARI